jgi:hypothetical protein
MWLKRDKHRDLATDLDAFEQDVSKYEKLKVGISALLVGMKDKGVDPGSLLTMLVGSHPLVGMGLNMITASSGDVDKLERKLTRQEVSLTRDIDKLAELVQCNVDDGLGYSDACDVAGIDGPLLYRLERFDSLVARFHSARDEDALSGAKGAMILQGAKTLESSLQKRRQAAKNT